MYMQNYVPTDKMDLIIRDMDRFLGEIFPAEKTARRAEPVSHSHTEQRSALPAIDMIDTKEAIVLLVEMPGVKKEDIALTLDKNTLSIKGQIKRTASDKKERTYLHMERSYTSYARMVKLPTKINKDKIKATLADGILEVRLSKALENKAKKIKVEVN